MLDEAGDRRGEEQDGGGEDRRNDAGRIHLQGQVGALPAVDLPPYDSAGILHRDPPVRPLEIDDDGNDGHHERQQEQPGEEVHFPGADQVTVRTSPLGNLATMPAKMMREIPLPIPRSVICSPSHIRNAVPEVSVMTVMTRKAQPGW